MGFEARTHGPPPPDKPELLGQPPSTEFLTPDDFSNLTRYVGAVYYTHANPVSIRLGFTSEVSMMPDKLVVGDDGGLDYDPQFQLTLGTHLTREQRGLAFVAALASVRSEVQLRGGVRSPATIGEYEIEQELRRIGIETFYAGNADLVDRYIDGVVQPPVVSRAT